MWLHKSHDRLRKSWESFNVIGEKMEVTQRFVSNSVAFSKITLQNLSIFDSSERLSLWINIYIIYKGKSNIRGT